MTSRGLRPGRKVVMRRKSWSRGWEGGAWGSHAVKGGGETAQQQRQGGWWWCGGPEPTATSKSRRVETHAQRMEGTATQRWGWREDEHRSGDEHSIKNVGYIYIYPCRRRRGTLVAHKAPPQPPQGLAPHPSRILWCARHSSMTSPSQPHRPPPPAPCGVPGTCP